MEGEAVFISESLGCADRISSPGGGSTPIGHCAFAGAATSCVMGKRRLFESRGGGRMCIQQFTWQLAEDLRQPFQERRQRGALAPYHRDAPARCATAEFD